MPNNRTGKILRRILTKIAADEFDASGDTSPVADPRAVNDILRRRQQQI
ncbi:MAG: hypothetical protein ACLPID_20965 [Beijerinckiaceae bacterium]